MKCAVAIVLAIIGMAVANPVPPLGLTGLASPWAPAVVTSSVINHGVTIPRVIVSAPIIKTSILPILETPILPALKTPVYSYLPTWNYGLGKHYL